MLQKYAHNTEFTLRKQTVYMGGGGRTRANLFDLPKIGSKLELSLMRLLRAKDLEKLVSADIFGSLGPTKK